MKKVLKFLLLLFVIVLCGLAYLYYMPAVNLKKEEAAFNITAEALLQNYESNEAASDKKYIDRIIDVNGTIAEISTDQKGEKVIILREGDAFSGVLCTLKKNQKNAFLKYKVGDDIRIRGLCTGKLMDVVLNKCVVME